MPKFLNLESEPVRLVGVTKRFGDLIAVDHLTLTAEPGEITTLLGPSGCGKTTTLRVLAGFYIPEEGEVYVGDELITDLPPFRRPTRTVFQNYALFPHMTVHKNVAFGLDIEKSPRDDRHRRVDEALELVGLGGLGDRQPGQLSGGQQQRVALARALVTRPKLLLLDEPLSNLDAKLRVEMREEIRRLQRSLGITVVYVTHDQEEALSLSDQIAVMNKGKLLQVAPPVEVYERPANRFVAQFLGLSNFLPAEVLEMHNGIADVRIGEYTTQAPSIVSVKAGDKVTISVRPENLLRISQGRGISAQVITSSYLGSIARYHVRVGMSEDEIVVDEQAPVGGQIAMPGDDIQLVIREKRCVILE